MQVNIREAKANFSMLIMWAQGGEEVTIAKAGKPVARLVPIQNHRGQRTAGLAKDKIIVRDDFDAPLPAKIPADFE
jgi:prevent-host-death family protein